MKALISKNNSSCENAVWKLNAPGDGLLAKPELWRQLSVKICANYFFPFLLNLLILLNTELSL